MKEKEKTKKILQHLVQSKEFLICNALKISIGTNTPKGGNISHGGITLFTLVNEFGTDWNTEVTKRNGVIRSIEDPTEIAIILYGDSEAETFLKCLKYAVEVLEKQMFENLRSRKKDEISGSGVKDGLVH